MKESYDVAIIGSGIGGLVCGCYLAKAGLRVLIAEQHSIPGGYCSSFKRKQFSFDVGPHYLGSLRQEGGILFKVLKELDLLDKIKFLSSDPTDRIIAPGHTVFIRRKKEDTKQELISHFPDERDNIERFFKFILYEDFLYIVAKTKRLTFSQLLDKFFNNYQLKAILSVLTINLNLPPSKASALLMIVLIREFILDGGYYPQGGMQVFVNLLVDRFKQLGGELILSSLVKKIITKQKEAKGIELENGRVFFARIVISNADASLTFKKLLDCSTLEAKKVSRLKPSYSAYQLFLGLNKKLRINPPHFVTWLLKDYDVEGIYKEMNFFENRQVNAGVIVFPSLTDKSLAPPGKDSLKIFVNAKYTAKIDWARCKEKMYNNILKSIEFLLPDIEKFIEVKEIATPYTFYKYTFNRKGALFGWQAIPSQIDKNVFPAQTSVKNLYLAGHWVTNGVGNSSISGVATTAKYLIKKFFKNET